MEKKYVLQGGWVYSQDKDKHYITATMLVNLYKLDRRECIIVSWERDMLGIDLSDKIVLKPRSRGDYEHHLAFVLENKHGCV